MNGATSLLNDFIASARTAAKSASSSAWAVSAADESNATAQTNRGNRMVREGVMGDAIVFRIAVTRRELNYVTYAGVFKSFAVYGGGWRRGYRRQSDARREPAQGCGNLPFAINQRTP